MTEASSIVATTPAPGGTGSVLLSRAAGLVPDFVLESPSVLEVSASAAELLTLAERRAEVLAGLVQAMDARVRALESAGREALEQAQALAADLVAPATSIGARARSSTR